VASSSGRYAVDVANLSVTFDRDEGALLVLNSLSMKVESGEFISILGQSGCGKTTLLRTIAGLLNPTSGSVFINGRPPTKARMRAELGFVFQSPVLFPWRTVMGNVLLPAEVLGSKISGNGMRGAIDTRKRAKEMLDLVGLRGFEKAYPAQLSGGMRSRVALARALSYEPEILLMDEPFGDLDEITRTRMNLELLRLKRTTGTTILFVTHSIREAVFLSDKVVVLTPRPSDVGTTLRIDLPKPRLWEMQETPQFGDYVRQLRRSLGVSL